MKWVSQIGSNLSLPIYTVKFEISQLTVLVATHKFSANLVHFIFKVFALFRWIFCVGDSALLASTNIGRIIQYQTLALKCAHSNK